MMAGDAKNEPLAPVLARRASRQTDLESGAEALGCVENLYLQHINLRHGHQELGNAHYPCVARTQRMTEWLIVGVASL